MHDKLDYKLVELDCIADISRNIYAKNDYKTSYLAKEKYEDSIFREIPKAIAKCMKNIDEFSIIPSGIVEFNNKDISKYTRSNLNALVLYNLIYEIYNSKNLPTDIYNRISAKIGKYYSIAEEKIKASIEKILKNMTKN